MTAREQHSLSKLSQRFDDFVEQDKAWKDEFKLKLDPLLQEKIERDFLKKYQGLAWKGFIAIIGALAAIGGIINYIIRPYVLHLK